MVLNSNVKDKNEKPGNLSYEMQICILRENEVFGQMECNLKKDYKYSLKCTSAKGKLYRINFVAFSNILNSFNNQEVNIEKKLDTLKYQTRQ